MNYRKLITNTKSTRDFHEKKIPESIIREVLEYSNNVESLIPQQSISINYISDGEEAYNKLQGIAGYHGIMIKAPQYLLFLSDNLENHQINVGYFVEDIILKLSEKEVDTCWINIPEDGEIVKLALGITDNMEAAALVAIGYDKNEIKVVNQVSVGDNYSKSDLKIVENNISTRLNVEEILYLDKWGNNISIDKLIDLGLHDIFHYAVMAPSTLNRQPWRFILRDKLLIIAIRNDENINNELDLLDSGIIMLFIQIMMKESNIQGKWTLSELKDEKIPDNYRVIGYFS
ncbi:MAG: nitroreductase family protein [Eubacteriaceae bacterium]